MLMDFCWAWRLGGRSGRQSGCRPSESRMTLAPAPFGCSVEPREPLAGSAPPLSLVHVLVHVPATFQPWRGRGGRVWMPLLHHTRCDQRRIRPQHVRERDSLGAHSIQQKRPHTPKQWSRLEQHHVHQHQRRYSSPPPRNQAREIVHARKAHVQKGTLFLHGQA